MSALRSLGDGFPGRRTGALSFSSLWIGRYPVTGRGVAHPLKPGDAVLLPRGDAHIIASAPGVSPVPIGAFPRKSSVVLSMLNARMRTGAICCFSLS
ncbi:hypothetical protein AB664_07200 [Brucella anthropi]|uniref:AraC-type transcription regulator ligand-binding domain-containing protein n=1 Tax=Brucella anthropi TaxID=529 RepID=A0A656Z5S1_BRUAN|nr:hypothetical protein AB664_07200 [Brucella anthropi]